MFEEPPAAPEAMPGALRDAVACCSDGAVAGYGDAAERYRVGAPAPLPGRGRSDEKLLTRFGLQITSPFTREAGSASARRSASPSAEGAWAVGFEWVASAAAAAEQAGFDSIWVPDNPWRTEAGDRCFECYTLLGALAVVTSRARIGAMVSGVAYRNPAYVVKQVSTLDVLSGGRAVLGIGAGCLPEGSSLPDGHLGSPAGTPSLEVGERLGRLGDALAIFRAMLDEDNPSYDGAHYRIAGAMNKPGAVSPEGIPILVGGGGERIIRLAAQHADACNFVGSPAAMRQKVALVRRSCEQIGRDPSSITCTRLGVLAIAETSSEARHLADSYAAARGLDEEAAAALVTWGDPAMVVDKAGALLEAGLDGLVFSTGAMPDVETIALAGHTLTRAFGISGSSRGTSS